MKIAICGDSFAANTSNGSWVDLLSKDHKIQHLAQPGVSEYKIYKQVLQAEADYVIVCHTSTGRVHTSVHPWHSTGYHQYSDLIFSDIEDKMNDDPTEKIQTAYNYFQYYFDIEYYENIYRLVRREINDILSIRNVPCLHIDNFESSLQFAVEKNKLDLTTIWNNNQGTVNHYSVKGNEIVYNLINERI